MSIGRTNVRPFLDFLREHRSGAAHDELSEAMQELVEAVTAENKGGTITLKISIKPAGSRDGALLVTDEVKVAAPKQTKSGSIFFASAENNLVREDPKQRRLPLRELSEQSDVREMGPPGSVAGALA